MKWIYRFDRKHGRWFGLSNLMVYVAATMAAVWLLSSTVMPNLPYLLYFNRSAILSGEVWRVITFVFLPLDFDLFRLAIYLLCYYSFARTVEATWGPCLFTLYYLFGILGAIIAGFITGGTTNYFLNLSIILAFACLYPEQQINIWFVLPIKAKWLGAVYAVLLFVQLWNGNLYTRVALVFSLLNALLFFGPDVWRRLRNNARYSKTRRNYRKQWGQDNNPWR